MANFSVAFISEADLTDETVDGRLLFVKDASSNECSIYFEHKLSNNAETATRMAVVPASTSKVSSVISGVESFLEEHFRS